MITKAIHLAVFLLREMCGHSRPAVPAPFLELGDRAMSFTRRLCELGARPPGCEAHVKGQEMIQSVLGKLDCDLQREQFIAQTPLGPVEMSNYIARFGKPEGPVIVLSGHYDTIRPEVVLPVGRAARCCRQLRKLTGRRGSLPTEFLGANDGGSSTALLLEMARLLDGQDLATGVWIVLFDGEEALVEWSPEDQTYGSRHQVGKWRRRGELNRIDALINVDMVGARGLTLAREQSSSVSVCDLVWAVAKRCGYGARFTDGSARAMGDDHVPFIDAGVKALDLIDVEYGPNNGFWHTVEDSPDKLCAHSFAMIAHVLWEVLREMGCITSDR